MKHRKRYKIPIKAGDEMNKEITFKSKPENWNKEKLGLKRNTVRKSDTDKRFRILRRWMCAKIKELTITLEQTTDGDKFSRKVTDVSRIDDYYIISW
jgi:hypothetical protein